MSNLQEAITNSTRWTLITEVMAKIITPISNMILARLLAPEAFGILATIMMVLTFADVLADAGFQKYIIQKEFANDKERENSTLVAIWSNIILALLLWFLIIVFRNQLAVAVGNPNLGFALSVAGLAIPMTSVSSIQLALLRRDFKFKTLFLFRLIVIVVPFTITIPLAYLGYEYWSLVIGNLVAQLLLAATVTFYSNIKLKIYFDWETLKSMLSFSLWTLIESISIWLTSWIDIFIVTSFFNAHYLGLYRMSMASVNSLLAVITASIIPVLYSALSRLQFNDTEFVKTYHYMLKRTAMFVIPLGIGFFIYRDLVRTILFGEGWAEADMMIGLWGITSCLAIIFCHFCSEIYRAKGKPRISFTAQLLHMIFLIPVMYWFSNSYDELVYARNFARVQFAVVHLYLIYKFIHLSPLDIFNDVQIYVISGAGMGLFGYFIRSNISNIALDYFSILLCIIAYFGILFFFKQERAQVLQMIKKKSLY